MPVKDHEGTDKASHDPSEKGAGVMDAFDDNGHNGIHMAVVAFQQKAKIISGQAFQTPRDRVASVFHQNGSFLANATAHKRLFFFKTDLSNPGGSLFDDLRGYLIGIVTGRRAGAT